MTRHIHAVRIAALLLAASAVACAKPFSPPGGEIDRTPPRLVSTTPSSLAVDPQFTGKVEFVFDETLAEAGINDALVSVSPRPASKVHVKRSSNRIEVSVDGGFTPNQVYRIVLRPPSGSRGISDRFSNVRTEPVELIFSTGPPIPPTAFAGLITDRLTGRLLADGAIEAVRRADSAVYYSSADSAGFFAVRSTPAGVYDVRAYSDLNRNRRLDATEPKSPVRQMSLGATDTVPLELVVFPFDTTGPRMLPQAQMTDSLHVTVAFDDPVDPEVGLRDASSTLMHLPDSVAVSDIALTLQLRTVFARTRPTPQAGRDSAGAKSDSLAAADTSALANARRARAAANPRGNAQRAPADTTTLPERDVVVTLSRTLPTGRYRITITNVHNVNGLAGGGSAEFEVRPPAPPVRPPGGQSRRQPR